MIILLKLKNLKSRVVRGNKSSTGNLIVIYE